MSALPLMAGATLVAFIALAAATQPVTALVRVSYYTAGSEWGIVNPTSNGVRLGEPGSPTRGGAANGAAATPVVTPVSRPSTSGPLAVTRPPSIDVATIQRVLQQYGSPAVGDAQAIYDQGLAYGIDPAVCLAFFIVESAAGTRGMATETRSVGNIRATPGYVNYKGYRQYATWQEGIVDWYRLIKRLYVDEWGLTTVEAIVPVYAPAEDSNNPASYTATVRRLVAEWQAAR